MSSSGGGSSGSKQQEYTEQQNADRADVTKALTDLTNMDTMDRWGKSSSEDRRRRKEKKEKDKKCTTSLSAVELAIANLLVVPEISASTAASLRLHIGERDEQAREGNCNFIFLRWGSARLLEALFEIINCHFRAMEAGMKSLRNNIFSSSKIS
jgi:hypothetical protein